MSKEFRVDITRKMVAKAVKHGLEIEEDSGLNYVDCYFPDGTQRTWGMIGRTAKAGDQFIPMSGCKQSLATAIQAEINKQFGMEEGQGPVPVMVEYVGNEFESEEEDDDDDD